MEFPRVGANVSAFIATLATLVVLAGDISPASAAAQNASAASDLNAPMLVGDPAMRPDGYRLTGTQARRIAAADPKIVVELRRHPGAIAYEYTKGSGRWQVSWFSPGPRPAELAQVYVDDARGRVTEAWTGFQVAWMMARGYPGAFGRRAAAWYVWLPLCVMFALPFLGLGTSGSRSSVSSGRFRGSAGRWRPSLLHLDLGVLLGFSISLAFFNHGQIGLSVPLAYPFLLYLLIRMLLLAFGRGRPSEQLRLVVPPAWLAVAIVFLVAFRVGLNIADSNVIDVGYAGVIGANKLVHGKPIYGNWPQDNAHGDTYGPVNYLAYVPFRAALGWSGSWDELPAAHAAAIVFDLLTLIGLYFLGRMVRGPTTGIVLAYAWAAYPFTLYALNSNSDDSLVALLVVLALLLVHSPPARGVAVGLAGLTKFAPLALAPLLMRGVDPPPSRRAMAAYALGLVTASVLVMVPVLAVGNLDAFWRDTISYQAGRSSPFSIWGLWGGLGLEQHLVQGGAAALALLGALVPRRRDIGQLAALGAAVLIALQLGISHWFYLYIPWFFPLVMLALLYTPATATETGSERDQSSEFVRPPLSAALS